MEERRQAEYASDEIDLRKYFPIFRKAWWKACLLSLAVGAITFIVMLQMPNLYEAKAVITPAVEEGKKIPAFGALALFGVDIGGPATVESLESLFKSHDLTVRVFRKHDLWSTVLTDGYDPATGKVRAAWTDRLFERNKESGPPGDWNAIRAAKKRMRVSINKRSGTLTLSFESASPETAASIVGYYLEEGKSRLQEEALERASSNKKFIAEQIARTMDPLTRDRLYALYGQEVEREMMARNREQFGFRVIDSPRAPDRKSSPRTALGTIASIFISIPIWLIIASWLEKMRPSPASRP